MHRVFHHPLPGGDLIAQGLTDLKAGKKTLPSLLVSIGSPNLSRMGLLDCKPFPDAEMELYHLLHELYPLMAHQKYNSYLRQLISFERACHCVI